jgi:hypothetical protein
MTYALVAVLAVVGLGVLLVRMSRDAAQRPPPPPMPEPADRTLADWRRDFEDARSDPDRAYWADCPCCGAPSYADEGGCDICGWMDGDDEALAQSRANFAHHGLVDSPEEMAEWGELPPTDEERAIVNRLMDLCDAAPAGRQPGAEYWERFQALTWELEAERDRRLQAAQQASAADDDN